MKRKAIRLIIILAFINCIPLKSEEPADSTKHINIKGDISITNNGFSFIPSFSLGKPAALANISVEGKRFSFDPMIRFDLEGLKPWSMIFVWRYKLVEKDRLLIKTGMHLPTISFKERTIDYNGETREQYLPYRLIAFDIAGTYNLSQNTSIGVYYLVGAALDGFDEVTGSNFVSMRAYFNNINITNELYLKWNPQLYYLNVEGPEGFYYAQELSLHHKKIPLAVSSMANVALHSNIQVSKFDWNVSLVYYFGNQYIKK